MERITVIFFNTISNAVCLVNITNTINIHLLTDEQCQIYQCKNFTEGITRAVNCSTQQHSTIHISGLPEQCDHFKMRMDEAGGMFWVLSLICSKIVHDNFLPHTLTTYFSFSHILHKSPKFYHIFTCRWNRSCDNAYRVTSQYSKLSFFHKSFCSNFLGRLAHVSAVVKRG